MARSGRFQLIGDEHPLGRGAVPTLTSKVRGGTYELVGDEERMSRKPIQSPSSNPRGGEYQKVGDCAYMSKAPVKGWGSAAHLTMSDRAHEQSRTAAGTGPIFSKGKKRR